jgi:hypothetical protein
VAYSTGADVGAGIAQVALRVRAYRLRVCKPRPFGLNPTGTLLEPWDISSVSGAGTARGALAGLIGIKSSIWTMRLHYGNVSDLSEPVAEVISDFHPEMQEIRRLGNELKRAVHRDGAAGSGENSRGRIVSRIDSAEVVKERREIIVETESKMVSLRQVRNYSGFQFRAEGILVTFIARKLGSEVLEFSLISDLEPFLARSRRLSHADIAAALDARRGTRAESS